MTACSLEVTALQKKKDKMFGERKGKQPRSLPSSPPPLDKCKIQKERGTVLYIREILSMYPIRDY